MLTPAVHVCTVPTFRVGDPPPSGYVAAHEWARVQHRGGLRQAKTPCCGLWLFPQEREAHVCGARAAAKGGRP